MKILQIAYNSQIAGGEKVLLNIINGLKNSHEVHVVVPEKTGELNDVLDKMGIIYHVIPIKKTYDLISAYKLYKLLRKYKFDIVNSHGLLVNIISRISVFLYRLFEKKRIKLFNTVHLTNQYGYKKMMIIYYLLADLLTVMSVDRIICVSCGVKNYVKKYNPFIDKISVVTNGICETEIEKWKNKIDHKRFLKKVRSKLLNDKYKFISVTVSRLSVQKNPFFLLKVAKLCPDIFFLVVGDGFLMNQLQKKAENIENIKFIGKRVNAFRYISFADVFFLPSLWEGFPLTILEAMYLKIPCIVSDIPGNNEIIFDENNGILCNPNSDIDCAKKLKDFLVISKEKYIYKAFNDYINRLNLRNQIKKIKGIYGIS